MFELFNKLYWSVRNLFWGMQQTLEFVIESSYQPNGVHIQGHMICVVYFSRQDFLKTLF